MGITHEVRSELVTGMTTITINFGHLQSAARDMRDVASRMESYADVLPRKINNPLSSLTGGSSSETSTVASLASQKARQLRDRAAAYRSLADKTERFADEARAADVEASRRIGKITSIHEKGLSGWDRVKYAGYKFINGITGSSKIGAFINSLTDIAGALGKISIESLKEAYSWFHRGDGKYFKNVVFAVTGALIAIFTCTAEVAAIIGCVIGVVVAVVTVLDSLKALNVSSSGEPGVARYYGSTSSLADYAKKHSTNRLIQMGAQGIDLIGDLLNLRNLGKDLFSVKEGTKTVLKFDLKTLKTNLLGSIGVTVKDGKYSFSLGGIFGIGNELTGNSRIDFFNNTVKPFDNAVKTFDKIINIDKSTSFKDIASIADKIFPDFSIIGNGITIWDNVTGARDFGITVHSHASSTR